LKRRAITANKVWAFEGTGNRGERFQKYYDQKFFGSSHLNEAVFFDKETFGADRLVREKGLHYFGLDFKLENVSEMPIADAARNDLLRLQHASVDYMPELTPEQTQAKLTKTSYKDFLLQYAKVHPDLVKLLQTSTHDLYCVGIDAVSARDCAREGFPGFKGMRLPKSHEENAELDEPYIFHFPDGNASIARMLVRSLVPGGAAGHSMEDVVTARANYARLDDGSSPVRIRLNSTAVKVKHVGDPASAKEVEVTYVRGGQARRVRGRNCILACYNMIIPYLCRRDAGETKRGARVLRETSAGLHQRANQQLEGISETWNQRVLRSGIVFQPCDDGFSGLHGQLSLSSVTGGILSASSSAHSVRTGFGLQGSISRGTV
jgi:hypothetical protein